MLRPLEAILYLDMATLPTKVQLDLHDHLIVASFVGNKTNSNFLIYWFASLNEELEEGHVTYEYGAIHGFIISI